MYIVTFDERTQLKNGENRWIESSRIFDTIDAAKNFVEFLFDDCDKMSIRDIRIWEAADLEYSTATKVEIVR